MIFRGGLSVAEISVSLFTAVAGVCLRKLGERQKPVATSPNLEDMKLPELVEYLDSFGNLYCVGRNGQHRYNNMDHSMATAIEAVGNIKNGKTSKKNVWSVNTDKSYHEEK